MKKLSQYELNQAVGGIDPTPNYKDCQSSSHPSRWEDPGHLGHGLNRQVNGMIQDIRQNPARGGPVNVPIPTLMRTIPDNNANGRSSLNHHTAGRQGPPTNNR